MITNEMNLGTEVSTHLLKNRKTGLPSILALVIVSLFMVFGSVPASAHCDSYDGPTIKDAVKALETNNVKLVISFWLSSKKLSLIP